MPNTYLRFLLIFSFIFPVFSKSLNPLQAFELCAVLRDPDVYLYEKIENNVLKIICDSEEAYNFGKQNYNITLENVGPDFCPQLSQSNISTRCCEDTMFLLTSAKQNERWALKIVDSFGKPPGGILFEQIYFYGDINQCYDTKVEVKSHQTKISQEPFKPKFSEISATFKTPKQYELKMTIAACLPESCQPKDIEILVSNGLPLLLDNVGHMQSFTVDYLEKPCLSKSAKISLLLLVVFTLLIFLATLYEVAIIPRYNSQQNSSNQSNKSESPTDNKEKHSKESLLEEFLLCFSLYKNTKNLLKTEMRAGSLPCLNGFRIIFHCSILFGHAYTCGNIMNFHYILRKDYISKLYFFISTEIFLLAVDSFFLTSGIVIAYTTLNTLKLKDGKINWVYFYFHRYWRITPPLVILAAVCVPLFPWLGKGHYWPHYELDVTLYENIWWIKLLYVDNIIGYNFLPWTWDLACNMQLFAISPLFIMSFYKSSKLGLSITSITLLASFIITGHKVMSPNYPLSTIAFRFLLNIYTKPVSRIGPYIIGIVYGYYLSKYDRKIQINKHLSGLFCILAVACILSLYSIRYIFEDIISTSQMMVAIFIAVHRSIWALCLGWIIYDCCTDCGGFLTTFMSWKVFIPLSRLTFIQSIIHPYAIIYFYRSIEYQGIFSEYFVIYVAFASLTISFIIAYIGSMAFEAPFSRMESLLWKKEKKS